MKFFKFHAKVCQRNDVQAFQNLQIYVIFFALRKKSIEAFTFTWRGCELAYVCIKYHTNSAGDMKFLLPCAEHKNCSAHHQNHRPLFSVFFARPRNQKTVRAGAARTAAPGYASHTAPNISSILPIFQIFQNISVMFQKNVQKYSMKIF